MKLYIYDHCPFCVRPRIVIGLRKLPVATAYLANDDEATPIRMIGAKQVPILEKPDGSFMGESLDIVHYLAQSNGGEAIAPQIRPEIQAWYDRVSGYITNLLYPRSIRLGLPEFATQSAIDYFTAKKEAFSGKTFAQMLAETPEYLARAEADLQELSRLTAGSSCLNGQNLSMEDIIIFPLLRNLSMVQSLAYPQNVETYLCNMAAASGINLYFDRAL